MASLWLLLRHLDLMAWKPLAIYSDETRARADLSLLEESGMTSYELHKFDAPQDGPNAGVYLPPKEAA